MTPALSGPQRAALLAHLRQARRPEVGDPAPEPTGERWGPVTLLAEGAGRRPLFLVHAVGGTTFGYVALARELSGTFRTYGIEADDPANGTAPATGLHDMVTRYTDAIRRVCPAGPFGLGGWSLGGLVAFEIARRLQSDGETVAPLVLIDTATHYVRPADPDIGPAFVVDVARSMGWDGTGFAGDRDGGLARLAQRLAGQGTGPGDGPTDPGTVRAHLERRFRVYDSLMRAVDGYRPTGSVRADAVVACAARSPNTAEDWCAAIDGTVRLLHLSADHYRCLTPPYVRQLADAIRAKFDPPGSVHRGGRP
ncbi:MAG TPA: thioesterase domain-containing protein [Rugosimonospora sp.]|nr:thioesterase domain-containing protein [Rugosimonospora sp.]